MINRNIKETLDLSGVEVNSNNTSHTCRCHEVCDELGTDRLTAASLAILASIGIVGNNGGD